MSDPTFSFAAPRNAENVGQIPSALDSRVTTNGWPGLRVVGNVGGKRQRLDADG